MQNILVTGGLGFIGSHTAVSLHEAGYKPVILDNLSNSNISVLDGLEKLIGIRPEFIQGDVNDATMYKHIFEKYNIAAVIHFAAYKAVGESVEKPLMYYQNNVGGLIHLLLGMEKYGVKNIVFSSSCTVYGEPENVPVNEGESIKPASSPYGSSKQMCEVILRDTAWLQTQCLRYFNPVGAHPSGIIGELPLGVPNNLVPYITQTAAGIRKELTIFGNDYPTADGTCIRDFIHIMDLAEAHVAALRRLLENRIETAFEAYNIGTGNGVSVQEAVDTFEKVNSLSINKSVGPRREGDVIRVWADTALANAKLGWKASRNLAEMMRDAWNWQQKIGSKKD